MGLFKKKYDDQVIENRKLLHTYAVRLNGLHGQYAEKGEAIAKALADATERFQRANPPADNLQNRKSKKVFQEIDAYFDELMDELRKSDVDETRVKQLCTDMVLTLNNKILT